MVSNTFLYIALRMFCSPARDAVLSSGGSLMNAGTVLAGNGLYGRVTTDTRISLYFLQAQVETRRWNPAHGLAA